MSIQNFKGGTNATTGAYELWTKTGETIQAQPQVIQQFRRRCTIAEINAGVGLLAAVPGFKYRLTSASAIAYGGAVGATTTVDVLGTQATSSVKLVAFGQAALTQSTRVVAGASGGTILADGASYTACDVNTAITLSKTGSNLTTATGVDIALDYVLEPA